MTSKIDIGSLPPDEAELREFISEFTAASARMRKLRRALAETLGITVAQHALMLGLWYCERRGSTTVRAVADHLHIAAAHVSAGLNKLERAGLVAKRPSEADKRAIDFAADAKRPRGARPSRAADGRGQCGAVCRRRSRCHARRARLFRAVIEHAPAAIGAARAALPCKAKVKSKAKTNRG